LPWRVDANHLGRSEILRRADMRGSRCNPRQSNQNGFIESRHDSLKTALFQALRLRASRAFGEPSRKIK
jgi:hypothetical protein